MIAKMKLYVFNPTKQYDAVSARAIVASSQEQAEEIYSKIKGGKDYTITVYELREGLIIVPFGHDEVSIGVELTQ